jgi:hypothetical protein
MTSKQIFEFWDEYIKLVNIIQGIVSEYGELSTSYWQKGVETEMEDILFMVLTTDHVVKYKKRIITNFNLLMDGLSGWASEGRSVSKYGSLSDIDTTLFE